MNIDWLALVVVAVASIVGAAVTVTLIATGIKLLAVPPAGSAAVAPARDDETDDVAAATRPAMATIGGIACFTLGSLVVLYGVYLIVPFFHRG
ncbi:hypothetical protein [Naasia aerilata]|uniref:Uncharacterized protein n=1 Tax=Naasia aerilata TaxID=1162966 RepID=A0ABM8GH19_9MICO|nr:hypothetical protein [Naasia aerilata]BDZ47661.1 hypothetical protein GCM10025866_35700 [Naasia aerilata]